MKPSFDTWTSVFLFAALQGVFVSIILLFRNKPFRKERILLAVIALLFSLTLADYVLYWTKYSYYFPYIQGISGGLTLLYGPLFYYYFKIIFENHNFFAKDLLTALPFALFLTFRFAGINLYLIVHFPIWAWLSILSMTVYAFVIYKSYKQMSKIQEEISDWFTYLFGFYIGFIISFTSYYVLTLTPFFDIKWDYMISFAMSFFIYFLSWFGYLQPKVFAGFSIKDAFKGKYSKSTLTEDTSETIIERLNAVMEKDKLYKDENMNLERLALVLNVSKHHLSQVINNKIGVSYFDFINSLRIKEAAALLSSTSKKEKNVLEIAFETGFRNKATFNNAFKKLTGYTPTEFREKNLTNETTPNRAVL
ncbi:MAG TPA: helix-turn-helix domain-containing protein [Ignavibacteriaceae bacterium]|nr:helix-turn-helix domain-containing protein [Ignavibacteriaceae bacterium]